MIKKILWTVIIAIGGIALLTVHGLWDQINALIDSSIQFGNELNAKNFFAIVWHAIWISIFIAPILFLWKGTRLVAWIPGSTIIRIVIIALLYVFIVTPLASVGDPNGLFSVDWGVTLGSASQTITLVLMLIGLWLFS